MAGEDRRWTLESCGRRRPFLFVAGHLRRLFETLGLERRPRDITPSLRELLQAEADDVVARAGPPHTADGETLTSNLPCGSEEHPASEEADA